MRPSQLAPDGPAAESSAVSGRWTVRAVGGIGLVVLLAATVVILASRVGSDTLMLSPAERGLMAAHGTWRHMFDYGAFSSRYPVLFWVVALVVVGLIGLPYAWLAGASLPDRGVTLARPIGLLLVTWLVWWLASLRLVAFTRGTIALSALVFAIGSAVIVARRHREMRTWVRTHWRLLLVAEGLFWSLLAAGILIRWANPDLWHPSRGGEKPMDFAYLNAVLKSTHFPPFDPWFAGGQMNYYYLGFVLVAVLVKATSIAPSIAYNLAVPTLLAFLGTATFGATLALADSGVRRPSWRRHLPVLVALLGALLVAVLGNLGELRVLADWLHQRIPIEWWYWNPTRVIHHPSTEPGPINELPFFTYLFGDLHAHAVALPFAAVALALSIGVVRSRPDRGDRAPAIALYVLLALVLGALWPVNTWDFPTYALIALVALTLQQAQRGFSRGGLAALAIRGAGLIALAYVLFLPFHRRYYSVFNGVQEWDGGRTRINDYLTIHGVFLFAIVSGLLSFGYLYAISIHNVPMAIVMSLVMWGVVYQGYNAVFPSFYPELFPTKTRVSGMAISQNIGTAATAMLPAIFVAVAPPGATNIPMKIGALTLAICVIAAIAAWSARETYRTHLNDLGQDDAVPVPKPEYDRLREQAVAAA